jgi:hypothetical protein
MGKSWKKIEITTHADQVVSVQPTPEMNGCIEFFFGELDSTDYSGTLYINKEELPEIIKIMTEMMNYIEEESITKFK